MPNNKVIGLNALFAIALLVLWWMSSQVIRYESIPLVACFSFVFLVYLFLIRYKEILTLNNLIIMALLFRVIMFLELPVLSDDFYRFLWDGHLIRHGFDPFTHTPSQFVEQFGFQYSGLTSDLFTKVNSPNYFTIYPPVAQYLHLIAAKIGGDNYFVGITFMRVCFFVAEVGLFWLMHAMLGNTVKKNAFLYFLNPLVILEGVGNLHIEPLMLLFFMAFVYFISVRRNILLSALAMAFSIATKLLPLLVLPFCWYFFQGRQKLWFAILMLALLLLLFVPFLSTDFLFGMQSSVSLYFQKFEFNGSVYNVIRALGFWFVGYNVIQTAGPILALVTFLGLTTLFFRNKSKKWNWFLIIEYSFLLYFLMASTLHPWYILTLIAVGVFTKKQFAYYWSFLIFFTYIGYTKEGFMESTFVNVIEYVLVLFVFCLDQRWMKIKNFRIFIFEKE